MIRIILYLMIIISIILICLLLKNKSMLITLICSILIISFALNPSISIAGTIEGAHLFFYKVFPSLFPFLTISNIMLYCNGVFIYSKFFGKFLCLPLRLPVQCSFVVIISTLCGYPLGAKYACELYEKKIIDFNTCKRLLNIASNASPLFVIGSVGVSMFKSLRMGYILLIANYLSCFIMSLIIKPDEKKIPYKSAVNTTYDLNLGSALRTSIEDSIKTSSSVGGFIILFSVINSIIKNSIIFDAILKNISILFNIPTKVIQGLLLGLIEMTNGCNILSTTDVNPAIKLSIASFLIGFSGLCILWQCNSFMSKFDFSLIRYSKYKLLQGIISSIICFLTYNIFYTTSPTFNNSYYKISTINLYMYIFLIIILPVVIYKIIITLKKLLFHTS
ncbi:sporulation integral membrane protein YlbJ [Clostridium sp. HMP27]|uniref:sporulation integral membrane protein YlbJ n=1 Tax=Clostridium sp. HMP27 TaxID=1487921 RepID=UPI000A7CF823|nr:sporulation integral membrane protein YlbJ [Clostridium sp. HMP27]